MAIMSAEPSEKLHEELAYLKSFGLNVNPFPVAPDVEHFFLSSSIDRLVTEIVHGTLTRKGFMVLTGEVGLGKTTISRKIIKILEERGVQTSLVFHTSYQDTELLREINRDFDLPAESLAFGDQMKILRDFLLDQNRDGKNCAILIDDAQNLNNSSLELVRMISNLEIDQQKLVQILLVGQPELLDKLESPELRQLKSRIIISQEVRPLTEEELKNYILFKLNAAGSVGKTGVDQKAVRKIHKLTGGNLRQINKMMDRCLYVAFLHHTTEISSRVVEEARKDLAHVTGTKRTGTPKRPFLRMVMLVVLLCAVFALLYPPPAFQEGILMKKILGRTQTPENVLRISEKSARPLSPSAVMQSQTASRRPTDANARVAFQKETVIPEAVRDFMEAYGLQRFAQAFNDALGTRDYKKVSEDIFRETGYSLIRLASLPEILKQKYGVLVCPSEQGAGQSFYLFWHPQLLVRKFYYGYQGKEIIRLQRLLAEAKFYKSSVDGIVGKGLMKSVVEFQKRHDIKVTGYPDECTLFLLYHIKAIRKSS
jgi:general secretion pathway protein A